MLPGLSLPLPMFIFRELDHLVVATALSLPAALRGEPAPAGLSARGFLSFAGLAAAGRSPIMHAEGMFEKADMMLAIEQNCRNFYVASHNVSLQ
jgi:hypothetical protein